MIRCFPPDSDEGTSRCIAISHWSPIHTHIRWRATCFPGSALLNTPLANHMCGRRLLVGDHRQFTLLQVLPVFHHAPVRVRAMFFVDPPPPTRAYQEVMLAASRSTASFGSSTGPYSAVTHRPFCAIAVAPLILTIALQYSVAANNLHAPPKE